jgi:hypothetical protein
MDAAQYFTDFMRSRVGIDPLPPIPGDDAGSKKRWHAIEQVSRFRLRQHRANAIRPSSETSLGVQLGRAWISKQSRSGDCSIAVLNNVINRD